MYHYHKKTIKTALELLGATGIERPDLLRARHVAKRIDGSFGSSGPPAQQQMTKKGIKKQASKQEISTKEERR